MVDLPVEVLALAVNELARGGRWAVADQLHAAANPRDDDEAAELALARARTEVDRAFWTGSDPDGSVLEAAQELARSDAHRWAAGFARLRAEYAAALRALDSRPAATRTARLAEVADELITRAPTDPGRAFVHFYHGVIADLLGGDPETGAAHYRAALETDDDYVRAYALRHLGAQAADAGDHQQATQLWQESTRLRQRTGFLPGVLAQLMLIADETSVGHVVSGWAEQAGLTALLPASTAEHPRQD